MSTPYRYTLAAVALPRIVGTFYCTVCRTLPYGTVGTEFSYLLRYASVLERYCVTAKAYARHEAHNIAPRTRVRFDHVEMYASRAAGVSQQVFQCTVLLSLARVENR